MQDKEIFIKTAKRCLELDLNPVPCNQMKAPQGLKQPDGSYKWNMFQDRQITLKEFEECMNGNTHGLGIVCGKVCGMLEVIDIDHKYDISGNLVNGYFKLINDNDPELFNSLFIVRTPTYGYHLYYRCEVIEGNQKLAQRYATDDEKQKTPTDKRKVLIETRGEGGYIVCPPTPGYEPWRKNTIPTITPEQRKFLLDAARSFNEVHDNIKKAPREQTGMVSPWEISPWDDFDQRGDISPPLEKNGWKEDHKTADRIYYTRPGKDRGTSADYHKEKRLFKCWSTSQGDFEEQKAYSHTAVYAKLECSGDFAKASEQLERLGYGKRKPVETRQEPAKVRDQPEQPAGDILKGVYIPNWDNRPEEKPPLVSLEGTGILTYQNITSFIAKPGMGKSSIVEAILASYINPNCDSLGFSVDESCNGVLAIDTERTDDDVWNSFYRYHKRAGYDRYKSEKNTLLVGLRFVSRVEQRREEIKKLIINNKPAIVVIDGAADLVYDTNDQNEARECTAWMRDLTVIHGVSILLTIHPNPNTDKPRGHLGSELCRESECVLLAKGYEGDTRILTSDFEHGKNRNNPKLTTAYAWSEDSKMFVSADYDEVKGTKVKHKEENAKVKLLNMAKEVLPPPTAMRSTDLKEAIMGKYDVSEKTAKNRIREMTDFTLIKKHDDELYRMIIN